MRWLPILISGIPLVLLGWQPARSLPADRLTDYRKWHLVTPQAVDMAPAIAMSCIGPSIWDQEPNPHVGRMFKVYVNATGKDAMLSNGKKAFPVGSIIVKEKFVRPKTKNFWDTAKLSKDAMPELLTVMVKREKGFDPANGDWEYQVLKGDGSKRTSVGLEYCAKCHAGRKSRDYVFGEYGTLHRGDGAYGPSQLRSGG